MITGTLYCCHSGQCGSKTTFTPNGEISGPKQTIKAVKQHLKKSSCVDITTEEVLLPWDFEPGINEEWKDWIQQYALSEDEIDAAGFGCGGGRLIMPIFDDQGRLVYYQGRGVEPKYLNVRQKRKLIYGFKQPANYTGTAVVLVEDIVSMIKVARTKACYALLGSVVHDALIPMLSSWPIVEVWLDYDKKDYSKTIARRIKSLTGNDCYSIITKLDPKDHIK